jgi:uncharacterized protein DUF6941
MDEPKLELEFLLVGEAADNANGKLYVIGGGWNQIQSPVFPTIARCGIAVSVLVPTPVEPLAVKIHYSDTAKTMSLEMENKLQPGVPRLGAKLPSRQRIFVVINGNFPVPKPGHYEITASLPDGQSKTVSFEATQIAQPTQSIMN